MRLAIIAHSQFPLQILPLNSLFLSTQDVHNGSNKVEFPFNSLFGIQNVKDYICLLGRHFQLPFRDSEHLAQQFYLLLSSTFNSLFGIPELDYVETDDELQAFNSLFGILDYVEEEGELHVTLFQLPFRDSMCTAYCVSRPSSSFQLPFRDSG